MDAKMDNNLLMKLKAGSKVYKDIQWPGTDDATIRMRILNDGDYLAATLASDKIMGSVTMANASRYNAELETQLLYRSITDPESGKSLGVITDFRLLISPEIKADLIDELDALHVENSPNPEVLSDEEFDKLFESVKKKPEEVVSSVSNINTLRKLVKYLVPAPKK